MLLGAVVMLFVSVHRSLFSVGVVPIQEELGLGASTVGVLQSAYLAGYALTNAPGGAIADRLGGAPVMLACLAAWSVAVALMPVAAASPAPVAALVALRLLFGLASGPALPGSLAVVSRWLPLAKRSSGIADIFVFFNAGNAVGLLLGGLIPVLRDYPRILDTVCALYYERDPPGDYEPMEELLRARGFANVLKASLHRVWVHEPTLPPGAGGETAFPRLGVSVTPARGKLVVWARWSGGVACEASSKLPGSDRVRRSHD